MRRSPWCVAMSAVIVAAAGCSSGHGGPSSVSPGTPSASPREGARPIRDVTLFDEVDPGVYEVDPDGDPETTMRVTFTAAAERWRSWVGTYKDEEGTDADGRGVGFTTAAPTHVVSDACQQDSWIDPGPGVSDLADALANITGFDLTAPVTDVTAYGYSGKHLELSVPPSTPHENGGFAGCVGASFKSWRSSTERARILERYYQGPGQIIELWILDVEGSRLLIEASRFPDSPQADVDELQAVLDSVVIDP